MLIFEPLCTFMTDKTGFMQVNVNISCCDNWQSIGLQLSCDR